MAAERNEHLVVIMLKPVPLHEEFEIWEPHITIVPWFPCSDAGKLNKLLSDIAARHNKFNVKAGAVEEWGRREKYPVQIIDDQGGLRRLHLDVFESLEGNGFHIHQKDFMGEKYTPHFALRNRLQKGENLPRGQEIAIDRFTLVKQVRMKGSGRMIKTLAREYELG